MPAVSETLPTLNPLALSFTPRDQPATTAALTSPASDTPSVQPSSPPSSTAPSLESLARELEELKFKGLSSVRRLAELHHQRRQLLSHMTTAKSDIDLLEGRLEREQSVEGSQDVLNRLQEMRKLHEWVGQKWMHLGEEVAELETERVVPGREEFWGL